MFKILPEWLQSLFDTVLATIQSFIGMLEQLNQTRDNIVQFVYVYLPNLMPPAFFPMTLIFINFIIIIIALKIAKVILDAIPLA